MRSMKSDVNRGKLWQMYATTIDRIMGYCYRRRLLYFPLGYLTDTELDYLHKEINYF